jgi:hypothetical protein
MSHGWQIGAFRREFITPCVESLLATERRRTNLFNFLKLDSATSGVLQLHIHVMPDLKGINDFSHVFPI